MSVLLTFNYYHISRKDFYTFTTNDKDYYTFCNYFQNLKNYIIINFFQIVILNTKSNCKLRNNNITYINDIQ